MKGTNALVWLATLVLGLHTINCAEVVFEPGPDPDAQLRNISERSLFPRLDEGQTWLVTTAYLNGVVTPTIAATVNPFTSGHTGQDLDLPVFPEWIAPTVDEIFLATITWEFRVLESDYQASVDSPSSEFMLSSSESVALIEAVVFDEQNTNSFGKELNPVFHILLRRSDCRLLSVALAYESSEDRVTEVLDLSAAESGTGVLLPEITDYLVDFIIPEFPLEETTDEMNVTTLEGGAVEVAFTSALDGGLVVQRWDAGRPWFTYSRSDNRISWLATQ